MAFKERLTLLRVTVSVLTRSCTVTMIIHLVDWVIQKGTKKNKNSPVQIIFKWESTDVCDLLILRDQKSVHCGSVE